MSSQTRSARSTSSSRGWENCAQPHLVFSNDDLLTEILIRLPILCIHLFTSVSKQWQIILTSPAFTLSRSKIQNIEPPAGIFTNCIRSCFKCNFVSFDSRLESKKPTIDLSFDEPGRVDNIWISQSCNGLLLCTCSVRGLYYVYNPFTNWFKRLPHPNGVSNNSRFDISRVFRMAFDPRKSPYYKVLQAFRTSDIIMFQIYSSETGNWSWCRRQFDYYDFVHFDRAVYWNNAFHWLEGFTKLIHRKLNIEDHEHPIMSVLSTPLWLQEAKIFESYGCLLLVCRNQFILSDLTIHEMMEGSTLWSVRYQINTKELLDPYPSAWSIRDSGFSIHLGERKEDAFLLISCLGKVFKFNLVSKTVDEISNQWAAYAIRPILDDSNLYEFIPSLASVCDASQVTNEPKKMTQVKRRSTRTTRVPAKYKE